MDETIEWISVDKELPDSDITVLVFYKTENDCGVWLAFFEFDNWRLVDGVPLDLDQVIFWADVPAGPEVSHV